MTMTLVQTITVGPSGAASIEFTGIPQTGTDLLVVLSGRVAGAAVTWNNAGIRINGITTGTYVYRALQGSGSAATSDNATTDDHWHFSLPGSTATSNTFNNLTAYLPNYASSTAKTVSIDTVNENNGTESHQRILAGSQPGTAAITTLTLLPFGTTFVQYSTASLYTITKGSGGATVS